MTSNETNIDINLRAKADTQQARGQFDDLFDDLKQGVSKVLQEGGAPPSFIAQTVTEFDKLKDELRETGASMDVAQTKLADLQRKLQDQAAQLPEATRGVRGLGTSFGQAALNFAYFADDLQYGLRGIMNNIPQLALSFGLGSGVAGVIGIATVALGYLWDKFGEASKAKDETDKVKDAVDDMRRSLKSAGDAAEKTYKADASAYIAEIERATESWSKQAAQIHKVLGYQNEVAKVQLDIANHQLEIQRQNDLATAASDEERKAINARYDARKGAINDAGAVDQAKRNLTATEAEDAMLRRQFSNVDRMRGDATGRQFQTERDRERFTRDFGGASNEGRQVREAQAAQAEVMRLQEELRRTREIASRPESGSLTVNLETRKAVERLAELEKEIAAADERRSQKNAGVEGARKRLASGNLTFADPESITDPAQAKVLQEARARQAKLNADREAAAKAVAQADAELAKIRAAEADNAKQVQLRRLELERAILAESEGFAKAGVGKITADQQAEQARKKQQAEEAARKLENDARAAEKSDPVKAAQLRNQAERAKLPGDATAEQRRAAELDAQERLENARKQQQETALANQSRGLGEKAGNLGKNLGAAGKELKQAADKLKDGGTEAELEAVAESVRGLAPVLLERFSGQEKKFSQILKDLELLKDQVRNATTRSRK